MRITSCEFTVSFQILLIPSMGGSRGFVARFFVLRFLFPRATTLWTAQRLLSPATNCRAQNDETGGERSCRWFANYFIIKLMTRAGAPVVRHRGWNRVTRWTTRGVIRLRHGFPRRSRNFVPRVIRYEKSRKLIITKLRRDPRRLAPVKLKRIARERNSVGATFRCWTSRRNGNAKRE